MTDSRTEARNAVDPRPLVRLLRQRLLAPPDGTAGLAVSVARRVAMIPLPDSTRGAGTTRALRPGDFRQRAGGTIA